MAGVVFTEKVFMAVVRIRNLSRLVAEIALKGLRPHIERDAPCEFRAKAGQFDEIAGEQVARGEFNHGVAAFKAYRLLARASDSDEIFLWCGRTSREGGRSLVGRIPDQPVPGGSAREWIPDLAVQVPFVEAHVVELYGLFGRESLFR